MRIIILSDGKYGHRAIKNIKDNFPNSKILFLPEYDTSQFLDEVEIPPNIEKEIKEADLIISYLRHPDVVLEICEFNKPMILAIDMGDGFYNQAKDINPNIIMPQAMCRLNNDTDIKEIDEFATYYGLCEFEVELDTDRNPPIIKSVDLSRESICGGIKEAIKLLIGKEFNSQTFNDFGLKVSQECKEPMTLLLTRSNMAESSAALARIRILEAFKQKYPYLFENSNMGDYYNQVLKDAREQYRLFK
ncbi:MAG: DUF166 family protein [Promethearchaeota archaeon]